MLPFRIFIHGDRHVGVKYSGIGKKQARALLRDMSYMGLKTGRSTPIRLDKGIVIESVVNYGLIEVHIYTPTEDTPPLDQKSRFCKCGQYFSEGVVVGCTPVDGYVQAAQLYTVDVCQGTGKWLTVENCVSNDFNVYSVNDRVWCCLSIREMIAASPYCNVTSREAADMKTEFPWGYMGTMQGYSSAKDIQSTVCYNGDYINLSPSAKGPCGLGIDIPDCSEVAQGEPCWHGIIPSMCDLKGIEPDCYWFFMDTDNTGYLATPKSAASLYTKWSMDANIGNDQSGQQPPAISLKYNLQIIGNVPG